MKSFSQDEFRVKNNNLFVEGLGSVGYYSLNFDKTIYHSKSFRDFIRVGGTVQRSDWAEYKQPGHPKSYYLFYNGALMLGTENGQKQLKTELAIGITGSIGEPTRLNNIYNNLGNERYQIGAAAAVGIRYYFKRAPLFLRACYTPFYAFNEKKLYPLWFGFAVGVNFGKTKP